MFGSESRFAAHLRANTLQSEIYSSRSMRSAITSPVHKSMKGWTGVELADH
jgi:hypothetical protein